MWRCYILYLLTKYIYNIYPIKLLKHTAFILSKCFHGDTYCMCLSVHTCVQSSKQHSFVSLSSTMWRWFGGVAADLSAARMTSFPGLLSPVTCEGFLLKSSISPCQSAVQPHPKTSADSSIRMLPIACLTARLYHSCYPLKKILPGLFPFCPFLFLFLPSSLLRALNFYINFSQKCILLPRLPPLCSLIFVWSHCL